MTRKTTLSISSKNYSSWSLRGWLLAKFVGLEFDEIMVAPDAADVRKELLLLSPSILVPCLTHEGVKVWDTLAIAEYLHETHPKAGLLPTQRAARAHCRAICGEMHSGFTSLLDDIATTERCKQQNCADGIIFQFLRHGHAVHARHLDVQNRDVGFE